MFFIHQISPLHILSTKYIKKRAKQKGKKNQTMLLRTSLKYPNQGSCTATQTHNKNLAREEERSEEREEERAADDQSGGRRSGRRSCRRRRSRSRRQTHLDFLRHRCYHQNEEHRCHRREANSRH